MTDHKPKKGVSSVAAARLQRWAILLSAYQYDIEFRSTSAHGNADALSRLPLPDDEGEHPSETRLCNIRQIEMLLVTSKEIRVAIQRDQILSKVLSYTRKGWPNQVPKALQPYRSKLAELSVEEGSLKDEILAELHREHMGISRIKALARGYVWWLGVAKDIERMAKS